MFVFAAAITLLISKKTEQCELPQLVSYTLIDSNRDVFNVTNQIIISGFNNYRILSINNQQIPTLCLEIFQVQTVVEEAEVFVNNCRIRYISAGPYEFNMVLNVLSVTSNSIRELTEGVFNEMKVRNLILSHNGIEWIEAGTFDNNFYLETLTLTGNNLRIVNSKWFFNTPFLYKIDISHNKLWTLQTSAFKYLVNCTFMSFLLDHNRIRRISGKFLKGFRYITRLDLEGNDIVSIPKDFFKNIMAYDVRLQNNNLSHLPVIFFQRYPQIVFLDLRKNRFSCAYLGAIKNYAIAKKKTVQGSWEQCYNLGDDR